MLQESRHNRPQKIVIVRPSALGDVCRTAPVLASLRAALPEAHLAWVVRDDFADAISAHPALNEVIAFPRSRFASWWRSPRGAAEVRRWFRGLRQRKFDVAIDCQGLSRSGLITRATRAPLRIGLRTAREFAWLCYNRRMPVNGADLPVHAVDRMLTLLAPLEAPAIADMRLYVPPESQSWWTAERERIGLKPESPYAVMAPGSRWPSKRWPIERFAEMVEPLLKRGFERVIVIGSASEREQAGPLLEKGRATVDLVGSTSVGQTLAIVAGAGLVIANDSAPLHMAVGFDRPCIALFGPTDPAAVGPYARAECVVRAYQPQPGVPVNYKDDRLGDSLMRLISTAMALQAVDRVLALWPMRSKDVRGSSFAVRGDNTQRTTNHEPRSTSINVVPRGLEPKASS